MKSFPCYLIFVSDKACFETKIYSIEHLNENAIINYWKQDIEKKNYNRLSSYTGSSSYFENCNTCIIRNLNSLRILYDKVLIKIS